MLTLEERIIEVKAVRFGDQTKLSGDVLTLNKAELINLIMDELKFSAVDLELASPGENCRIVRVADVIEPRVKISGQGQVFPGMIGSVAQVGAGQTVCLKGLNIVETWQMPNRIKMMIDMEGEAAGYTPLSNSFNLVIVAKPLTNLSENEYASALKHSSLELARYLAEKVEHHIPKETVTYSLEEQNGNCSRDLPRLVYVCQLYAVKHLAQTLIYGHSNHNMFPTIMHPNEFFDGALVNYQYDNMKISETTKTYQNQPVIKELYRRHGKDLLFAGVILKDTPYSLEDKKRSAMFTAKLARWLLQADGVILTKEGGGHPQIDLSLISEYCAAVGITSTIILAETGSSTGLASEMTLFNAETATNLISCGRDEKIEIKPAARIIGDALTEAQRNEEKKIDVSNDLDIFYGGGKISIWSIRGAISQVGENHLTTLEL